MAVVKPLYVDSGNLREMDTTKVDELIARAVYQSVSYTHLRAHET